MMRNRVPVGVALLALCGCAAQTGKLVQGAPPQVEVQILALNDLHGNLDPSAEPIGYSRGSELASGRLGGAANLAATLSELRAGQPQSITVAAGDLIGASPLSSAYFLDEPTIGAMNLIDLDLAAVGNHEFDKGSAELLRKQRGGCDKHTTLQPCRLEAFKGASFQYLSANVTRSDGSTLFPGVAIRHFGPITIGFIGETLTETGTLVTPSGVAGLHFSDEAATANALVPQLRAAGADAIVLLLHQGARVPETYQLQGCAGLSGDILPILDKLDPAITTVISGHTHAAYACEIEAGGAKRLLTSAGKYGYFLTDVRLTFDAGAQRLLTQQARNVAVIPSSGDPTVAAFVKRYSDAAAPAAARVIGRLAGPVPAADGPNESPAADLIADAQLAATASPARGGADLSFINTGGVRRGFEPASDGSIAYGQAFSIEPFGNTLIVKSFTGAQLKALLERQFEEDGSLRPSTLIPSANFRFSFDRSRPAGDRITEMLLDGKPVQPDRVYRITVNNFLASGGDQYPEFSEGTDAYDAGLDLDALEAWLATNPPIPTGNRVRDVTPD